MVSIERRAILSRTHLLRRVFGAWRWLFAFLLRVHLFSAVEVDSIQQTKAKYAPEIYRYHLTAELARRINEMLAHCSASRIVALPEREFHLEL